MAAPAGQRRGWWARARARPLLVATIAMALVALVAFVLVWFQPQALLFDTVVDEEFPAVADEAAATDESHDAADPDHADEPDETDDAYEPEVGEVAPAGPRALASGGFESRNRYTVTGEATVYELEDGGGRSVRLEPFESTNGPDLYVYLTAAGHADDDDALDADFVDLGGLRGNIGNQNYEIPTEVDLDHYDSVVIWCRRFTTSFGVADLAPVG